jgi:hypothetical protein
MLLLRIAISKRVRGKIVATVHTERTSGHFLRVSTGFYCQSYELIGRLVVDRDWWTGTVVRWQSWQRIHL